MRSVLRTKVNMTMSSLKLSNTGTSSLKPKSPIFRPGSENGFEGQNCESNPFMVCVSLIDFWNFEENFWENLPDFLKSNIFIKSDKIIVQMYNLKLVQSSYEIFKPVIKNFSKNPFSNIQKL